MDQVQCPVFLVERFNVGYIDITAHIASRLRIVAPKKMDMDAITFKYQVAIVVGAKGKAQLLGIERYGLFLIKRGQYGS